MSIRERRDASDRLIRARTAQAGHPLRADITVTTRGRMSLGRAAPRTYSFSLDMLHGQASEEHLLRSVRDAVEAVFYGDIHMRQRAAVESGLSDRQQALSSEHEAFMASRKRGRKAGTK